MFQELRSLNTYLVHAASLPMPPSSPAVLLVIAVLNEEILSEYNDMGHRTGVCQSRGAYLTLCRLFAYPHSQNTQDLGMGL